MIYYNFSPFNLSFHLPTCIARKHISTAACQVRERERECVSESENEVEENRTNEGKLS